jgi:hypothetical protein
MSFVPLRNFEGKQKSLPMGSSVTLTKNSLCKMTSGYLAAAAAGDNEVEYVALETKTNSGAAGAASALVLPIDDVMDFEALTGTTPVQATHVGNDYDLGAAASLDLTATTDKVFHVDSIKDAANKIVVGRFNKPAIA